MTEPTPRQYLLGRKSADIAAGIGAAVLWWAAGITPLALFPDTSGIQILVPVVALLFIVQLLVVGKRCEHGSVFVVSQILAAVLLPILALGLAFGACLISGPGNLH